MSFIIFQEYHGVENNFKYDTKLMAAKSLHIAMLIQNDYATMNEHFFP